MEKWCKILPLRDIRQVDPFLIVISFTCVDYLIRSIFKSREQVLVVGSKLVATCFMFPTYDMQMIPLLSAQIDWFQQFLLDMCSEAKLHKAPDYTQV